MNEAGRHMKCLLVAYINSAETINDLESVMGYYNFSLIETNVNYRAFLGHCKGSAVKLLGRLNTEMEEMEFSIEDSIFFVYPVMTPDGRPSLSCRVIKRKGNKYLRKKFLL